MGYYNNSIGTEATVGCLTVISVIIVCAFLFSLPVMWLWNWLMPDLFNLPTITWTQALGLNFLCGFLFRGNSTTVSSK